MTAKTTKKIRSLFATLALSSFLCVPAVHAKFLAYDSGVFETFAVLTNLGLVDGVHYDRIGGAAFSGLSVAEIQGYDFVYVGWSGGGWTSAALGASNLDAAVDGRVVITGQDADWHGTFNPDPVQSNAQAFLQNMFDWAAAASGTGLVALSDYQTLYAWTSLVDVGVFSQHANDVAIIPGFESEPIFDGLTSAELSGWGNARHAWLSAAPTGFTAVATDSGGTKTVTVIKTTGVVPEPGTILLLGLGLVGFALGGKRRVS